MGVKEIGCGTTAVGWSTCVGDGTCSLSELLDVNVVGIWIRRLTVDERIGDASAHGLRR